MVDFKMKSHASDQVTQDVPGVTNPNVTESIADRTGVPILQAALESDAVIPRSEVRRLTGENETQIMLHKCR